MTYTTVLVDIDDTIWDTQNNSREAFREMYDDHKWNKYFNSFSQFYDKNYLPSNVELWSLYAHGKISKEELIVKRFEIPFSGFISLTPDKSSLLNQELLNRVSEKTKLVDNAREVLSYLKPKYQLVVLSNGFREVQYKKLKNSGLEKFFSHVILSDEAGVNKPHPEIFNLAMKTSGANVKEIIMLGDSWESDIKGAENSGIDQIWYNPDKLNANGFVPTHTITNLLEVKQIL